MYSRRGKSHPAVIVGLGVQGLEEIRDGCVLIFLTLEIQSLRRVLACSPENDLSWAGWSPEPAQVFLSQEIVTIAPAPTPVVMIFATTYMPIINQAPYQVVFLEWLLCARSYSADPS